MITSGTAVAYQNKGINSKARIFSNADMMRVIHWYDSDSDYQPIEFDRDKAKQVVIGNEQIIVEDYSTEGLQSIIKCSSVAKTDETLLIPVINYPGMIAFETEASKYLKVSTGEYHLMNIEIPAGFSGEIVIDFEEP